MGNNPSAPSKAPPPLGGHQHSGSPRTGSAASQRTANRHPHPVTQRLAAPPEQSLAQAKGSNARPKSMPPLGYGSSTVSSSSPASSFGAASKPTDIKPRPGTDLRTPEPTNPIAVPNSQPDPPTSPLSPYPDSVDAAAMMPQSSISDMSYLTRPPRLPLPIEEEVHTPGSPIIAPTDIGEPVDEVGTLESEGLTRKASTRSASTIDEDDSEELRVDKNRPSVATTVEWLRGGDKVYVTGTIFQWNRKQRLHPV
jgi:hypothetical protein